MIAIRSYFVTFTLVIGPGLASPNISLEDKNQFYSTILNAHNYFRKIHGAQPLTFDQNLEDEARRQVISYANGASTLDIPNNYGVNKSWLEFNDNHVLIFPLAVRIVGGWYYTSRDYNFFAEPTTITADEFTQVVWMNTKSIAIDIEIKENKLYVVVVYSPAGNERYNYRENVGIPKELKDLVFNHLDLQILRFLVLIPPTS